jgi:glucose/arabinose dehydrogenase
MLLVVVIIGLILVLSGYILKDNLLRLAFSPTQTGINEGIKFSDLEKTANEGADESLEEAGPDIEIVAQNLSIPWEVAFLPDGDLLVTERPGRLLRIGDDRKIIEVSGVRHVGEGGLMGLVLDPDFGSNNHIYLYFTSDTSGLLENRAGKV